MLIRGQMVPKLAQMMRGREERKRIMAQKFTRSKIIKLKHVEVDFQKTPEILVIQIILQNKDFQTNFPAT